MKNERRAAAVQHPQAGGPGAGGTVAVEGVGKGEDAAVGDADSGKEVRNRGRGNFRVEVWQGI